MSQPNRINESKNNYSGSGNFSRSNNYEENENEDRGLEVEMEDL
jgi:hypothetical protein